MIGISKGLEAIINFKDPDKSDRKFFGSHLDLKPQNVLVDSDSSSQDTWKISDMGQAEVIDQALVGTSGSSRFSYGGTDAYAPPEYRTGSRNSRYDVWSLGIILLEVLAFAIKGTDGLTGQGGLDAARYSIDLIPNHRFYTGIGESAVVKPGILRWIDEVLLSAPSLQRDDKMFASNVVQLIKRMLRPHASDRIPIPPNKKRRISIATVVNDMKSIFDVQTSGSMEQTVQQLKQDDETTLVDIQ
jgi:serine/threonine protein kinase